MNRLTVYAFEKLEAQLDSLHAELTMLAKKSPNDAVNEFKLKFINSVLEQNNSLFGQATRPFAEFETFSTDTMPSNSDATFILSQYIECAEKFRADNIKPHRGSWWWKIDREHEPTVRTAPPRKIIRK
jgi:hypothetical protein